MKVTCLTLILFLIAFGLKAQSGEKSDSLYIVTYTTGPSWDVSKKPNEQVYFKEHSANLAAWRKEGIIKVGGRHGEKGMLIISSPSLVTAKERIVSDAAVVNKLFTVEIQKLFVFYEGCVDRIR